MPSSTVLYFCLLTLLTIAIAQPETKADWCRHVSIVSRPLKSSTKSTGCFIPIQSADSNFIALRNTIDAEWHWSLDLSETSSGQAFIVDKNTVTFLSQKVCLDAGNAIGHPIRPLYENVGNKSLPIGLIGDFRVNSSHAGDIYSSCVQNPTIWRDFTFKNSLREEGTPLQVKVAQYVQVRKGGHESRGSTLIPFDFNYTAEQLEKTFQIALHQAAARNKHQKMRVGDIIQPGKPVLLTGLPFATGPTLVATNGTTGLHREIYDDITIVAWTRLLEAVASSAGRPAPPVLLPESIKDHDIMALTVLAVISIVTFKQALSSVAFARRTDVKHWDPPRRTGKKIIRDWALITTACEHSHLAKYQPPFSAQDLSGPSVAFLVAIVTIIGAVLHFRSSSWRYDKFIVVRQGGLITYGPSNTTYWSYDLQNGLAGAIFVAGHWYVAQIIEVGHPGLFELIAGLYCLLILSLFCILYKFSTVREHKLDRYVFRVALHFFRAIPQAAIGGLLRLSKSGRGYWFFSSYRSTYLSLAYDLAKEHGLSLTPDDRFSKRWDGELTPRPRRSERASMQGSVYIEEELDVQLTADDVEKAAAFLAADRFGRLCYAQVIALLSCSRLLRAADMFRNFGDRPRAKDIRGFAQLFYVKGILLPEKSEKHGITCDMFEILDIEKGAECLVEIRESVVMLLALPPGHRGVSSEGHGFAVLDKTKGF